MHNNFDMLQSICKISKKINEKLEKCFGQKMSFLHWTQNLNGLIRPSLILFDYQANFWRHFFAKKCTSTIKIASAKIFAIVMGRVGQIIYSRGPSLKTVTK